jgi:hypothetical protein
VAPSNGVPLGIEFENESHPITRKEESYTIHRKLTLVGSSGLAWGISGDLMWMVPTKVYPATPCKQHLHWGICAAEVPHVHVNANYSSIPTIYFYGLGPSSPATQYQYGENQFGGEVDGSHPLSNWLDLGAELEGVQTRLKQDTSITSAFTEATAPGLTSHPVYLHSSVTLTFHGASVYENSTATKESAGKFAVPTAESPTAADEAARLQKAADAAAAQKAAPEPKTVKPRLTYTWNVAAGFHEYLAPGDNNYTYKQFTYTGQRTINVGGILKRKPQDPVDKELCGHGMNASCDFGTITLNSRLVLTNTKNGAAVPFYRQETLGGSDINSLESLRGYGNYRFRDPDAAFIQAEYGIRLPIKLNWTAFGPFVFYDAGTVGQRASDLALSDWRQDGGFGVFVMFNGSVVVKGYLGAGAGHGVNAGASFNHFF